MLILASMLLTGVTKAGQVSQEGSSTPFEKYDYVWLSHSFHLGFFQKLRNTPWLNDQQKFFRAKGASKIFVATLDKQLCKHHNNNRQKRARLRQI